MKGWRRLEQELRAQGFTRIAGVDEAGRGPLAGPVVAAAVMLPPRCRLPGLADSKTLSREARERLFPLIRQRALGFGIASVDVHTIDRINILQATYQAMKRALAMLRPAPEVLLVDGLPMPDPPASQHAIVAGDRTCRTIAAASILAKVVRDRMMDELDERYPGYGFRHHKGYATPQHLAQLSALGPCAEHRLSFAPVRDFFQQRLPFDRPPDRAP